MFTLVLIILATAFATEALVELLVKSKFFEFPRQFLSKWSWFKSLINCGYCTSVWVAMGLISFVPMCIIPISRLHFVNISFTHAIEVSQMKT